MVFLQAARWPGAWCRGAWWVASTFTIVHSRGKNIDEKWIYFGARAKFDDGGLPVRVGAVYTVLYVADGWTTSIRSRPAGPLACENGPCAAAALWI